MMLFLEPSIEAFRLLNATYVLRKKDLKHEQLERVLEANGHFIYQANNSLPGLYCTSDVVQAATTDIKEIKQVIHEYNRPAVMEEHVDIVTSDCDISGLRVYTNNSNFSVRATDAALVVLPYGFHRN
jgi:hypothetical protein